MATRKMTFTLPDAVAARFLRTVPQNQRSRYVSEALSVALAKRDQRLAAACDVANQDADVVLIEAEFDALPDTVDES